MSRKCDIVRGGLNAPESSPVDTELVQLHSEGRFIILRSSAGERHIKRVLELVFIEDYAVCGAGLSRHELPLPLGSKLLAEFVQRAIVGDRLLSRGCWSGAHDDVLIYVVQGGELDRVP